MLLFVCPDVPTNGVCYSTVPSDHLADVSMRHRHLYYRSPEGGDDWSHADRIWTVDETTCYQGDKLAERFCPSVLRQTVISSQLM